MATPETCPNCGAEVPIGAKACPQCGSDETTGWSETAYASGLGLPSEDFDYEEFSRREFDEKRTPKPEGISWIWWVTAAILALLFLLLWT